MRALRGESTNDGEFFIRNGKRPDGVCISANARPLRDAAGALTGAVSVFRDVTRQVRTREALAQAFAAGRLEVIQTVLHNIGNAINSVTVGVESLHDQFRDNELVCRFTALADAVAAHQDDWIPWLSHDPQGRQVRAFFLALASDIAGENDRMLQTATRVRGRVQHIVDIIRTQAILAHGGLERKTVRLESLIGDAVKVLETAYRKRAIEIDFDCTRAPAEIVVQESAFQQALVNLVKNAVEAIDERALAGAFDEPPRIRVLACLQDEFLAVDVIDNGIGIRPEHADTGIILAAGYTTKASGSGLGLHSVRNFATTNGGSIQALSDGVGRGTTMRLRLPLSGLLPPAPSSSGKSQTAG